MRDGRGGATLSHGMKNPICALVLALALTTSARPADTKETAVSSPLDYKMNDLAGKPVDLAQYKGKVVLFVNVASQCGYTKQYKPLQELSDKYKDQGLVVIGVPANDFGAQEPGSDSEIQGFCQKNYGVKFLVLSKVPTVLGDGQVPLYKTLTSADPKFAGPVKWNFTKFLVDRKGQLAGRFEPAVDPLAPELVRAVEAELAKN